MLFKNCISILLIVLSLVCQGYPVSQSVGAVTSGQNVSSVQAKAAEVLNKIVTPDMDKPQIAAAIYNYVKQNILYSGSSDKGLSWQDGAMIGFAEHAGDCYIYFSTAKALYEAAGIPNIDVIKRQTGQSSHYWSLIDVGSGWYHTDCTPRRSNTTDSFFLYTDREMLAYSAQHNNCFEFDPASYPSRQTDSYQSRISYDGIAVRIKESR